MSQLKNNTNLSSADRYRAMRKKLCFNQNLLDFIEIFILMFVICNIILLGSSFVTKGHNRIEMLFTVDKESVTKSQVQQAFTRAVPQINDYCEKAFLVSLNKNKKLSKNNKIDNANNDYSIKTHIYQDNLGLELILSSKLKLDQNQVLKISKLIPDFLDKLFYEEKNKINSKKNFLTDYKSKLKALLKEYPDFFRYLMFDKIITSDNKLSVKETLNFLFESNNILNVTTDKALKNAIDNINNSNKNTDLKHFNKKRTLLQKTAQMHSCHLIVKPIYDQIIQEGIKQETARFNRIIKKDDQKYIHLSSINVTTTTLIGHFKKFFIRFSAIALFLSLLIFPIVSYSANSCKNN